MLFSKYNCIFIHVSKTGGTSIERFFESRGDEYVYATKHAVAHIAIKIFGRDTWEKSFKFSFVRNPWDRIYSWWYNKAGDVSKSKFLKYLKNLPDDMPHVWNQVDFLKSDNGKMELDFIGRFERLQEDFDYVCDEVGMEKGTLGNYKFAKNKPKYSEYYNDETRELVSNIYKKDIDYFGYKFDQ
jgi:hypothetical protein